MQAAKSGKVAMTLAPPLTVKEAARRRSEARCEKKLQQTTEGCPLKSRMVDAGRIIYVPDKKPLVASKAAR